MRPVIFLTFANQTDDYLAMLKQESRDINATLQALHDAQAVEVYREESAGTNELLAGLNRFRERVNIFHYAGHAGGGGLQFEGGDANAAGLAQLLGALPNLKVVFLNGCSTEPQVDYLLERGVKAVIATSVPINDTKATEFATEFYRALTNRNTIRTAFQFAVNALKTKYGGQDLATIVQFRGFGAKPVQDTLPWGLYLNQSADDILDWTLPTHSSNNTAAPVSGFTPNKYLIDVLPSIADFDKAVEKQCYDADGKFIADEREALALVIEKYPWVTGIQLRLLSSADADMSAPTLVRLKQILSVYISTGQLLYYSLLSDVWANDHTDTLRNKLPLTEIKTLDAQGILTFDYIGKLIACIKGFKTENLPPFVSEFPALADEFDAKSDFYNAYQFLEGLRQRIASGNLTNIQNELVSLCDDAEFHLSAVLIATVFICKYELVVVRDINIDNPRHRKASFNHFIGKLNVNAANTLTVSRKPRSYASYMASSSIILSKDLSRPDAYIDLSPFIIDKNAYASSSNPGETSMVPHIFQYGFKRGSDYVYLSTMHGLYRALETPEDQIATGEEDRAEARNRDRVRDRSRTLDRVAPEVNRPYAILQEEFDSFGK